VRDKLEKLRALLRPVEHWLVAFSGGVDSSFLLWVAAEALGSRVTALTTRSDTSPEEDVATALALAEEIGVRHVVVDHDELGIPGYSENPPERCYLCKRSLYEVCRAEAAKLGATAIADGVNCDDRGDYRPGLRAADEFGVRHPLVEAGLLKAEIRALSRTLGLPTWDKPASPCLSSRFPYGERITVERLRQVGAAERVLHRLGFGACRVRFHEAVARIEVPPEDLRRLLEVRSRTRVVREFKSLGFTYVTLDLQGFRSGSLNEELPAVKAATPPIEGRLLS